MILLDTHIWIWWVSDDPRLGQAHIRVLQDHAAGGLGVSIISCWEVAKLVQVARLVLDRPVLQWLARFALEQNLRRSYFAVSAWAKQ